MPTFSIAVLPGDGVGLEVMPAALQVLDAVAQRHDVAWKYTHFDWGSNYYFEHGRMMPPDGVDQLRPFDAILLGIVVKKAEPRERRDNNRGGGGGYGGGGGGYGGGGGGRRY
jgi:isocitrate/isopropylmalate dehydrogenase